MFWVSGQGAQEPGLRKRLQVLGGGRVCERVGRARQNGVRDVQRVDVFVERRAGRVCALEQLLGRIVHLGQRDGVGEPGLPGVSGGGCVDGAERQLLCGVQRWVAEQHR